MNATASNFNRGAPIVATGQTIRLGYGKANFSNTLATYGVMKVTAPFNRVTAITSGKTHGIRAVQQAGPHEMNGVIINTSVEHDHGSVLLLQASWKRGGAPVRDAALFLRLRVGAPLYHVNALVPTDRENLIGDRFCIFSGYADLMNVEELGLLGIEVNRSWRSKFTDMEEIEECFDLNQLQGESVGRPQLTAIATPTGVQLREVPQEARRRLILRRK